MNCLKSCFEFGKSKVALVTKHGVNRRKWVPTELCHSYLVCVWTNAPCLQLVMWSCHSAMVLHSRTAVLSPQQSDVEPVTSRPRMYALTLEIN